uniref:Ig-like domain-containing protein n=1 Tax=Mola mola TaxID=94237 RepID=A0A3Q3XA41_MOLML
KACFCSVYLLPVLSDQEAAGVTLQCRLDPHIDLLDFTVDWRRVDLNQDVHVYRHKRDDPAPQVESYRGRTSLDHEELRRGFLTLSISSLQLSDSGPYTCYVPKLNARCTIELSVASQTLLRHPPRSNQKVAAGNTSSVRRRRRRQTRSQRPEKPDFEFLRKVNACKTRRFNVKAVK